MAENEKLTILHLMSILMEETDKDHTLNADTLCALLDSRCNNCMQPQKQTKADQQSTLFGSNINSVIS